jgi:hypothetical protein
MEIQNKTVQKVETARHRKNQGNAFREKERKTYCLHETTEYLYQFSKLKEFGILLESTIKKGNLFRCI